MTNQSPYFTQLTDLAAARLGGKVIFANDEFFAEKENLLLPGRGIFIPDKYTDRGKWMDGWETRRRRTPGHDWCVIQLAAPGKIKGFDIDTHHFLGNHPPFASVDAIDASDGVTSSHPVTSVGLENLAWTEILPKSPLQPGSQNFYEIASEKTWTHLRLNIYPDGGVARFRAYGEVVKRFEKGQEIDLAAAVNGGRSILCNDMFFSHIANVNLPGSGVNMGDGWETKRSRIPGNRDWLILRLAAPGFVQKIAVDTAHFKGNYPDACSLEGCVAEDGTDFSTAKMDWLEVLPPQKLQADRVHIFENEIVNRGAFTHVRLNIFPDGGVSRLRIFGIVA